MRLIKVFSSSLLLCAAAWPATEAEILATFELHPDFRLELAAIEPAVMDPVDLEFDERGRPFVIEMPGYPFPAAPGKVVLLKDEDGDGRWETRHVFAEGFPVADSLLPWNGGILVASPPDLLFLKDTDGDDVADVREVLLSGFAVANPQHNFNGLTYGLDNWIWGANGGNSGAVFWPDAPDEKRPMRFDDFRVDFRARRFETVGRSTGGFEITFDAFGRMFGTHNLMHIRQLVMPGWYVRDLPVGREGTLANISDHEEGGTARAYPIGEQETRVNHPEQSGYFSGACGIRWYGGGAFGEGFEDSVYVCDVVLNLVHQDKLSHIGTHYTASRAREGVDFLASTDRAFRPVNLTVGPDGAMYVVDMHRDVIEHPEWIPDEIEQGLDLEAGKQQGRIFRIVPKKGLAAISVRYDRENVAAVVADLAHANQWRRTTAQRLLVEWQDEAAEALVAELLTHENPHARVHALYTLAGLDALSDQQLFTALRDRDLGVRENALKLSEPRLQESEQLRKAVTARVHDGEPRVRMQAALTLSTLPDVPLEAFLKVAESRPKDAWTRLAALTGFQRAPGDAAAALLSRPRLLAAEGGADLLAQTVYLVGERGSAHGISGVMAAAADVAALKPAIRAAALDGLADGLDKRDDAVWRSAILAESGAVLDALLNDADLNIVRAAWRVADLAGREWNERQEQLIADARVMAQNGEAPLPQRIEALALLAFAPDEDRVDLLFDLLDTKHPPELQRAAIDQLDDIGGTEVAARLIAIWDELGRGVLAPASDILLYQGSNHDQLLTALEEGKLSLGQLNLHLERRRVLLRSGREDVRERAAKLFTDAGVVTRKEALEKMRPALELTGDPAKGRLVFQELCMQCHRIGGEGVNLGPDLTEISRKSRETLLHDIVDPNAAVDTEYISYAIETHDGTFVSGIVASETDAAVTLRAALGEETTIARSAIKEMFTSGLSIMPEEMEVDLDPQAMADLLAFLQAPVSPLQ